MDRSIFWFALWLTFLCGCQPAVETHWQVSYMQGDKAGYSEQTTRHITEGGRDLLEISNHNQIAINRFGHRNQFDLETKSVETPAGDVLRFRSTANTGSDPIIVDGVRSADVMKIETTVAGQKQSSQMPWNSDCRGLHAVEQSLERKPLKLGETRRLKQLLVMLSDVVVADVELSAADWEQTELPGGARKLLHVDATMTLPGAQGAEIRSTIWADEKGRAEKISSESFEGLAEVSYRTTRDVALAEAGVKKTFDLGINPIVKVDRRLPPPAKTRRVRYRVELDGKDPAGLFPSSATQQVKSTGPNSAEILCIAPSAARAAKTPATDLPTRADSAPSSMIQSADPLIVAMAEQARGDRRDPEEVAFELEKYVRATVKNLDFSQAFGSALEVARSKQGDCTEHAVLLAALARASGLPARVAIGLIPISNVPRVSATTCGRKFGSPTAGFRSTPRWGRGASEPAT